MKSVPSTEGSATKYTPGRWEYNAGGGTVRTTDAVPTVVVASYVDEWNGSLIAAAPDLLAALKQAQHYMRNFMDMEVRYPEIQAAIDKAEGR